MVNFSNIDVPELLDVDDGSAHGAEGASAEGVILLQIISASSPQQVMQAGVAVQVSTASGHRVLDGVHAQRAAPVLHLWHSFRLVDGQSWPRVHLRLPFARL